MPTQVTVTLEGSANLARTLGDAGRDLGDLTPAHQAAADRVAAQARARAPRRSGRLAATIRATADKTGGTVAVGVVYAGVQEYGWPARRIPAQAYLIPAGEAAAPGLANEYGTEVQDILGHVRGV
jgi:hypothetical protein